MPRVLIQLLAPSNTRPWERWRKICDWKCDLWISLKLNYLHWKLWNAKIMTKIISLPHSEFTVEEIKTCSTSRAINWENQRCIERCNEYQQCKINAEKDNSWVDPTRLVNFVNEEREACGSIIYRIIFGRRVEEDNRKEGDEKTQQPYDEQRQYHVLCIYLMMTKWIGNEEKSLDWHEREYENGNFWGCHCDAPNEDALVRFHPLPWVLMIRATKFQVHVSDKSKINSH